MASIPRLLVATEFPPNASGGGPAVVRQMLAEYPPKQLCWWSVREERDQKFGRKVKIHRTAYLPDKLYPYRKLTGLKSWILENWWSPWAAGHLRRTLHEIQPEVVWVIPHNWSIPPLAAALPGSDRPFHASIQDYVDVHQHPRQFGADRCRRMASQADELYRSAASRDAISSQMIDDLEKRTGAKADQILRAGLEPGDFSMIEEKTTSPRNEIRIAYAGSILVPEVFEFFIKALDLARKDLPQPCTLELFGAHALANRPWFDPSWMREGGNLTEPELKAELRRCSWGFAPMLLRDEDPRYNRFSFPTKFVSYLATGLPVITLGHESASVAQMARAYGTGFYSGTTDLQELAGELKKILREENPREKFRPALQACARKEFDAALMRRRLLERFNRTASGSGTA